MGKLWDKVNEYNECAIGIWKGEKERRTQEKIWRNNDPRTPKFNENQIHVSKKLHELWAQETWRKQWKSLKSGAKRKYKKNLNKKMHSIQRNKGRSDRQLLVSKPENSGGTALKDLKRKKKKVCTQWKYLSRKETCKNFWNFWMYKSWKNSSSSESSMMHGNRCWRKYL